MNNHILEVIRYQEVNSKKVSTWTVVVKSTIEQALTDTTLILTAGKKLKSSSFEVGKGGTYKTYTTTVYGLASESYAIAIEGAITALFNSLKYSCKPTKIDNIKYFNDSNELADKEIGVDHLLDHLFEQSRERIEVPLPTCVSKLI